MPPARLIDGRAIADQIHQETSAEVRALTAAGLVPGLAFVRVGEDPASQVYVGMKERTCSRLGIASVTRVLPEATTTDGLLEVLDELNADPRFHGILVQAPLPRQIDSGRIYGRVSAEKDVDGFNPVNVGKLMLGDPSGFVPCTPAGVVELLVRSGVVISGADVVILGRGQIVGKPLAALLMQKGAAANATVTVCHSQTRHLEAHCRRADILVAALGVARFVKADMVKPGAVVIDVGVNRVADPQARGGSRLVGDVDFEAVREVAGQLTPNPGGVGPMTIALLMRNTARAARRALETRP